MTLALTNNITANVSGNNFDFGSTGTYFPTGPAPTGINTTTDFAAKYTGYFCAPTTATYWFNTYSDDDSMLWLNGADTAVSQNPGATGHGVQNATTVIGVPLTAGAYYPITVGYDQGTGLYGLRVFYATGSTAPTTWSTLLPVSLLYTALPASNYSNPLSVTQNSTLDLPAGNSGAYQFPSLSIGAQLSLTDGAAGANVAITGPTTVTGAAALNVGNSLLLTLSGGLSGSGNLTKSGSGTLTLGGTGNAFTGGTTINSGVVQLANANALVSSTVTVNATGGLIFPSGVTAPTVGALAGSGSLQLQTTGGSPAAVMFTAGGNGQNTTFSGTLGGSGSLVKTGSGTLTLTGNNSFAGNTYFNGGLIEVSGPGNLGGADYHFGGGGIRFDSAFDLTASGDHAVVIDAGGATFDTNGLTVTLAANAILSGLNSNGADSLTKAGAGTLILANTGNSYAGGTTVASGTLQLGASGVLGSTTAPLTVNTGGTLDLNGYGLAVGKLSGSGTITDNSGGGGQTTLSTTVASGTSSFSGTIAKGPTRDIALTKYGNGTLVLSGSNTYGGGTTIAAGTVSVSDDANLGVNTATTGGITFGVSGAAVLQITGTSLDSSKPLTLAGTGTIELDDSSSAILSGNINGAGGLTKTGSGTLTISGTNGYTGLTTVSGGALVAASVTSLPQGGAFDIGPAGTLLLMGDDVPQSGTGDLRAADAMVLGQFAAKPQAADAMVPMAVPAADDPPPPSGGSFSPSAVPEPGTLVLLAAGLAGLAVRTWRRRKDPSQK
jgi:autotransporter-associated beta strand protein